MKQLIACSLWIAFCFLCKPASAFSQVQYLHILSTGQSLAEGATAIPALSTTQPYNNLSLSPDLFGYVGPMIPLVEGVGDRESPSSGLANTLHALDSAARPVVIGLHASGGASYIDLKKGTGVWNRAMAQVAATKVEVEAMSNAEYRPIAVTVIHGEADNYFGNAALYQGYLEEWQQDYETDISNMLDSAINLPMFLTQMNTGWTGEMAIAQYATHKANPGKIILVGPKYQYTYSDNLHLINVCSKHHGEMFGKVIHEVVVKGNTWNPLMPTYVYRDDNMLTVDFHIPVGTLAFDTTILAKRPNYGFEFVQTGGNNVTITSVSLVNNNSQVQIILDSIPTGSNQLLRYAYTCYHGGTGYALCGDHLDSSAVGGNLRDTDNQVSPAIGSTGLPLYNWCVTFEEPVMDVLAVEGSVSKPLVDIYPNPAHGRIDVALRENGVAIDQMTMRDLSGKLVRQWADLGGSSKVTLDIEDLPQGIYMLAVKIAEGQEAYYKVVVQ